MQTLVNVDTKMSKAMREALTHFEFRCIGQRKKEATEDEVREFLRSEYSPQMARAFKPEYLYQ